MKKNDIFMIHGSDYREMTKSLLHAADLAGMIGNRKAVISLKPNLAVAKSPSSGATTHAELLEGTIEYLKEQGFSRIRIMEGSWVGDSTERAFRAAGYDRISELHQIPLIDLQKDRFQEYDAAGMKIKLCDTAVSSDFVINMPVLKGHCQTTITCALKNNKGVIPNSEKRRFHTLGLHKPIAHLNTIARNDFILVDNICGDLDFEEGGNPVPMDRILGFTDPVLCDAFVCDTMGFSLDEVPYIRMAEKLGVGSSDLSQAEIHMLNQPSEPDFSPKPSRRVEALAQYICPENACSACYGSLIHALNRLDEAGLLKKQLKASPIAIGQGCRNRSGFIGVGRCTGKFCRSLKGCPPKASEILEFLKKNWLND
ncbi:DUF362 domain-containing protein [Qiania dongpingensis]|uniref:DUF362 domain-containing protein n=1 Tax=Qiania dongpingensis TaxID=2763669 RepID=A0A7G9G4E8_9FIRM|nr:DUF362 domain-containing protein [Qiania dongpingensis]QNM05680.1 DUF362 domain-containing protein [Qiania dongpingensis]